MKKDSFRPYFQLGLTAFLVIALSILFFFSLFKVEELKQFIAAVFQILTPFIYGAVLAYLLIPVFNFCYRNLYSFFRKHIKKQRKAAIIAKGFSTALSITMALLLVVALISLVLPQVVNSIIGLIESNLLMQSIQKVSVFIEDLLQNNPQVEAMAIQMYEEVVSSLTNWVKADMLPQLTNLVSGLVGTITVLKNIAIGVIIAVYLLNSKELFSAQAKKLLYSVLKPARANVILNQTRYTHQVFGGFISGKLLDSLIIGIICFIGMSILKLPYTMLVSVVIGVTNIIPFFGPFIGAVPCGLLILLINPWQALYFILFIIVLQQFDGNILGPKILGESTGLSSFWVMFAILMAGGLFGFTGMIVGVPVFAVAYSIISSMVKYELRKKGMPEETHEYYNMERLELETKTPVYFETDDFNSSH